MVRKRQSSRMKAQRARQIRKPQGIMPQIPSTQREPSMLPQRSLLKEQVKANLNTRIKQKFRQDARRNEIKEAGIEWALEPLTG